MTEYGLWESLDSKQWTQHARWSSHLVINASGVLQIIKYWSLIGPLTSRFSSAPQWSPQAPSGYTQIPIEFDGLYHLTVQNVSIWIIHSFPFSIDDSHTLLKLTQFSNRIKLLGTNQHVQPAIVYFFIIKLDFLACWFLANSLRSYHLLEINFERSLLTSNSRLSEMLAFNIDARSSYIGTQFWCHLPI